MTYESIAQMIDSISLPNSYYQFDDDSGQEPPFICFYYPRSKDFYADNQNYQKGTRLIIELYTDEKDFEKETEVEDALTEYGLTYSKEETYISSEKMYVVSYEMEVIIDAREE